MADYVVTDLTRFKDGHDDVCTALIDIKTGQCVRPIPYLKMVDVRRLGILPGSIVRGDFVQMPAAQRPHREDSSYGKLNSVGAVTAQEFKEVLKSSLSASVKDGLGGDFDGVKLLPVGTTSDRSIITIKVNPANFRILKDKYEKYKVHFTDSAGDSYSFIPITDLGFYEYLKGSNDPVAEINSHFRGSAEIYLRLGVSRIHEAADRKGYWMQVNGIYSFPNKLVNLRGYAP
ncbi:hypothetical protein NY751_18965 [Xanthomonas campestris]|uniref:hypothetical protein n=1 Tax=Xanthomonas campestris TaxID=339 RepID=UPI002359A012|nr:hypothetical protein [Xanthomonas campestris]MDC8748108.1 hypothetical protein [Xanthomonas campestris]